MGLRHRSGTTLGRNRVATHRVNLGNQCNLEFWIGLGNCNCSPKSPATRANNGHVRLNYLHSTLLGKIAVARNLRA
jgi:hypothetical protein